MDSEAPDRLLWFPGVQQGRVRATTVADARAERIATDEEFLERAQTDEATISVLFDRYAHLFLVIAFRILRDRGEAEDMVQEIFLHIVQQAGAFDAGKGSARTWMVKGEEDSEPEKADQHVRWRDLRKLQDREQENTGNDSP